MATAAAALRQEGNALYQRGRFEAARECYARAIAALEGDASEVRQMQHEHAVALAQLYSNRAQTYVQERNFAPALQEASKALAYDSENDKAHVRFLLALENLERFETALEHIDKLLDKEALRRDHATVFEYAVQARRRLRKLRQQDKAVAERESHAVGRMVDKHQQLRINLRSALPAVVQEGEYFEVAVNIGNEFGLFRRDYMGPGEAVRVQCVLRSLGDSAFKLLVQDADADGCLTLSDRGKAVFKVAVIHDECEKSIKSPGSSTAQAALGVQVHPSCADRWDLLPVVSLPFTVSSHATSNMNNAGNVVETLGLHCCRPVQVPSISREILLAEAPGNLGIGGKLWDSCLVLTEYLVSHKHLLAGKQVIELGSGLGLVGICCAMLGAHVTLTDMEPVVPLLEYNIQLNFPLHDDSTAPRPQAVAHTWGTSTAELPPSPAAIVMSDVVYDPEGYAPLVKSLCDLTTSSTLILMAHRSRNPMEHQFFALLEQHFEFTLIDHSRSHATTSDHDHVSKPWLQDIKLFRITRQSTGTSGCVPTPLETQRAS